MSGAKQSSKESNPRRPAFGERLYVGIGSSLRAMNSPNVRIRKAPLYANKPFRSWYSNLCLEGWQGLVWADFDTIMKDHANPKTPSRSLGLWKSDWMDFVRDETASHTKLFSPLDFSPGAGWVTKHGYLPPGDKLNDVMCTVAELLRSCANETYKISVPQYLFASDGGFTTSFFIDDNCPAYRCFLYLGSEIEPSPTSLNLTSWERQHAAIVAHSPHDSITLLQNPRTIPTKALNMRAFYNEGGRKFRMHPGDIIVLKGGFPFAVELPIRSRVPGARMISWCLIDDPDNPADESFHLPDTALAVKPIEEHAYTNEEARALYEKEMDEISDEIYENYTPTSMERIRVTPGVYDPDDIWKKIEEDRNVLDIYSPEFWSGKEVDDESSGWSAGIGGEMDESSLGSGDEGTSEERPPVSAKVRVRENSDTAAQGTAPGSDGSSKTERRDRSQLQGTLSESDSQYDESEEYEDSDKGTYKGDTDSN